MNYTGIRIGSIPQPMDNRGLEVVERKGIGHPDTLADGIAETISIDYCKYCLEKFGVIPHHNLDKLLLMGGQGKFGFGIGKMTKPWQLVINGRMSDRFGDNKIDVKEIQLQAAKRFLRHAVPFLNIDKWLKIHFLSTTYSKNPYWFRPRTINDIPDASNPRVNDTSIVSGYWPLSTTEKLVLSLEKYFYNKSNLPKYDYIGQDIKVMAIREDRKIDVIMCIPVVCFKVKNYKSYHEKIEIIKKELSLLAMEKTGGNYEINLHINTQDETIKNKSEGKGFYFVISGSALDSGEEGAVGRGNRSRGIIPATRNFGMEAICGKNPVYHVGKLYTYLADILAKDISESLGVETNVMVVSKNGDPIYTPYRIYVQTSEKRNAKKINSLILDKLEARNLANEIISKEAFIPIPGGGNDYHSI